jgi:hypothetical protein
MHRILMPLGVVYRVAEGAPAEELPRPLEEAIRAGRLTQIQHAALEHAARQNRRSLAAEIRAALQPPTV